MAHRLLVGVVLLASVFAAPHDALELASRTDADQPESTVEVPVIGSAPQPRGGSNASAYYSPAWIPHGENLEGALTQATTNGASKLGTLDAVRLPKFLSDAPLPHGKPWGLRTAKDNYAATNVPNTGVTRHYTFTITEQDIAPDGVVRTGIVVNGGFPGPTIEANWGDMIEVVVHNQLPNEGTTLHWHGLLQSNTPYMDGVPAVTMCPIAPGSSFTYRFQADLYGTSWYHSHYSAQYAGGALGAMIIYGPNDNADYDEDLGPILIGDWYHQSYYDLVEQVMAPISAGELPPESQNSLINGKMNFPCADADGYTCTPNAGISKFQIESGKTYRLRVINAGAEGIQKFSIDGYNFTVIANDFVPIVPYVTDVLTLGIGQRSDIILTATGKPKDSMWMRANLGLSAFSGGCTLNNGVSPEGVAAIYYQHADTNEVPKTNSSIPESVTETCANDPLTDTVPYSALPAVSGATSATLEITYASNGTNDLFFVNNSTFRADYNRPALLEAKLGKTDFPADYNMHAFDDATAIQLIVYNYAQTGAHPMHLHGHNMQVLAVGQGTWDGSVTNPANPQRRDVQLLPVAASATEPGYIVISFAADNPGVWPFHCHIAWHVSAGLYVNILENLQQIQSNTNIPSIMAETCRSWTAWTGESIPDEIDSGL